MAPLLPRNWRDVFADDSCPPFEDTQEACEAMQEHLERTQPPTDTQALEEGAQLPDYKPEEREEADKDEEPEEPEEPEKPDETEKPQESDEDSHNGSYNEPEPEKPEELQADSTSDGDQEREYQKYSRRKGAAAPESESDETPKGPEEPQKPEEPEEAQTKAERRHKQLQTVSSSDGEEKREQHKYSSRIGAPAPEDETEAGGDQDTEHQELVPEVGNRREEEREAYVVHSSPDTGTTEPAPDAVERARASCKCVLQVRPD